jgi:hypothetical protein
VVTIKPLLLKIKSPVKLAGLFFVALLSTACNNSKSPEEVTALFWQNLAQGQLEAAKKHATQSSQHLVKIADIDAHSNVLTGEAVFDKGSASVQTTLVRNKKNTTFNTVLTLENDQWKVDCLQTQMNISMAPFGEMLKNLQVLGGAITKQLEENVPKIQQEMEQGIPKIQKELEAFGESLKKQFEGLGRALEPPPKPPKPANPKRGTAI